MHPILALVWLVWLVMPRPVAADPGPPWPVPEAGSRTEFRLTETRTEIRFGEETTLTGEVRIEVEMHPPPPGEAGWVVRWTRGPLRLVRLEQPGRSREQNERALRAMRPHVMPMVRAADGLQFDLHYAVDGKLIGLLNEDAVRQQIDVAIDKASTPKEAAELRAAVDGSAIHRVAERATLLLRAYALNVKPDESTVMRSRLSIPLNLPQLPRIEIDVERDVEAVVDGAGVVTLIDVMRDPDRNDLEQAVRASLDLDEDQPLGVGVADVVANVEVAREATWELDPHDRWPVKAQIGSEHLTGGELSRTIYEFRRW
jgi:hypothetical protein